MRLEAKGTALIAGLVLVAILSGLGFYRDREPRTGKGNCYCENYQACGFDDPNECVCCEKIGGCRPPKGGPSCRK